MQLNTLGLAHAFLRQFVQIGNFCIDATAGKGRDTALLCQLVGESGRVIAFDIQPDAITQTTSLLASQNLRAEVVLDGHENMGNYAKSGCVDCIVFNFGRLPGGDTQIFTTSPTSIRALAVALDLLRSGGALSLSIYYGGANGYEEKDAILSYLRSLDPKKYSVLVSEWTNRTGDVPISAIVWKD